MLRVIRFVRPRWIVGENVHGIISWNEGMVFDEVQADLEAEGYEVWPYVLPACGVNAPHRRDRVWFVAYNNNRDRQEVRFQTRREKHVDWLKGAGFAPNPKHNGHLAAERGRSDGADSTGSKEGQDCTEQFEGVCESEKLGGLWDAANACDKRLQRSKVNGSTGSIRQKRNEQLAGHIPPNWQKFPTQPPIRSRNDGISTELDGITFPKWRNESIKAAGNAIVPQVVLQIFKTIEQFESVYLNPTNSNK